jgi:pSer/pThr/pTyr-binding forkhead associated (FHA) protein
MRLVLRFDGQDVQEFVLDKNDIKIGRNHENDITIDNLAISGHHASVFKTASGFELVDMKSTNGTFVNDNKIDKHHLQDGDIITIGKHQLVFYKEAAFSTAGSDDQGEATVMMSADFQKQLQEELSKSKAPIKKQVKPKPKKGFFAKLKSLFGL